MAEQEEREEQLVEWGESPLTFDDVVKAEWEVDKDGDIWIYGDKREFLDVVGTIYNWLPYTDDEQPIITRVYERLITNAPVMYRILKAVVDPDDFVATKTIVALLNLIEGKESE